MYVYIYTDYTVHLHLCTRLNIWACPILVVRWVFYYLAVSALVTSPLSNTIVEDGSKATLSCEFFMPPDTQLSSTVSWYKDRVLLALSEEFSQSVDRKDSDHVTATLHIREIFPDDEGEYSCIVKGHNWEVSSKARLTIAGTYKDCHSVISA